MKLSIPEVLKAKLVDDWEAVTKNNQVCRFFLSLFSPALKVLFCIFGKFF